MQRLSAYRGPAGAAACNLAADDHLQRPDLHSSQGRSRLNREHLQAQELWGLPCAEGPWLKEAQGTYLHVHVLQKGSRATSPLTVKQVGQRLHKRSMWRQLPACKRPWAKPPLAWINVHLRMGRIKML